MREDRDGIIINDETMDSFVKTCKKTRLFVLYVSLYNNKIILFIHNKIYRNTKSKYFI